MSTDIRIIPMLGIELSPEEFKPLNLIPDKRWNNFLRYGEGYSGINRLDDNDKGNYFGWIGFPIPDPKREGRGSFGFLMGYFFENSNSFENGDGTGGMYIEMPKPYNIETARGLIVPRFKSLGIKNPDIRLYTIAEKW